MTTGAVLAYDEPDQLRAGIEENLVTLGLQRLAAVNLRIMDGSRPGKRFDAQLAALIQARRRRTDRRDRPQQHIHGAPAPSRRADRDRLRAEPVQPGRSTLPRPAARMQPRKTSPSCRSAPWAGHAASRTPSSPIPSSPISASGSSATPAQIALAWLLDLSPERPAHPRHPDPPTSDREHPIRHGPTRRRQPSRTGAGSFPPSVRGNRGSPAELS